MKKQHNKEARARYNKTYYSKIYESSTGRRWTPDEIQLLCDNAVCDREISKRLQRSLRAIQIKRSKLRQMSKFELRNKFGVTEVPFKATPKTMEIV